MDQRLIRFYVIALSILLISACQRYNDDLVTDGGTIGDRFRVPDGYERINVEEGSFEKWLRDLPLKDGRPYVKLYNGSIKYPLNVHAAVVDMDIGDKDLQQCADCIIRLKAEYLWQKKRFNDLHFEFTSGDVSHWEKWRDGWRPQVRGNNVKWVKSHGYDNSYKNFRRWLENVFYYAGTISLSRELGKVQDRDDISIGDVFVDAGSPGHAVIVVDMAVKTNTDEKIMLLLQGYMPAQEMHVLVNPNDRDMSPWYQVDFGDQLETPEWDFRRKHLRRFNIAKR